MKLEEYKITSLQQKVVNAFEHFNFSVKQVNDMRIRWSSAHYFHNNEFLNVAPRDNEVVIDKLVYQKSSVYKPSFRTICIVSIKGVKAMGGHNEIAKLIEPHFNRVGCNFELSYRKLGFRYACLNLKAQEL